MGQQQLLLVILVTIIVGIATVVAINIFGTAAEQANRDAVRQDLMGAAGQAQAIWARPQMMGGVSGDFNNFTADEILERLNIPRNSSTRNTSTLAVNDNGDYSVVIDGDDELTIRGVPSSSSGPDDFIELTISRQPGTDDIPAYWDFDWSDIAGSASAGS